MPEPQHASAGPSAVLAQAIEGLLEVAAENPALGDDAESEQVFVRHYLQQLAAIVEAAEEAEALGLYDVCQLFFEDLNAFENSGESLTWDDHALLKDWALLLQAHAACPSDLEISETLVQRLQDARWTRSLPQVDLDMLQSLMAPQADAQDVQSEFSESELLLAAESAAPPRVKPVEATGSVPPELKTGAPLADEVTPSSAETYVQDLINVDAETTFSDAEKEVLELLLSERANIAEAIASLDALARNGAQETDNFCEDLRHCADDIGRFGDAVETVGFTGLQNICRKIRENTTQFSQGTTATTVAEIGLLQAWIQRVEDYLRTPRDASVCTELIRQLQNPAWADPVAEDQAAELVSLLKTPDLSFMDDVEDRQTQAQPEDVSLELPQDVNPELLDSLLQELPAQTQAFSGCIERLGGGGTLKDVKAAQRIAHTLKGAANTVGVPGIANLTHRLEDILLAFSQHNALPTRGVTNTLMNASDCLEMMGEALTGVGNPPSQALEVLQEVLDCAAAIERDGIPQHTLDDLEAAPAVLDAVPEAVPAEPAALRANTAITPALRVEAPVVDNLLRLVGENIILTGQVHEQLERTRRETRSMQSQFRLLQQLTSELEELIELKGKASPGHPAIREAVFDPLEFEQYSELHTCSRRLMEAATDAREAGHGLEDYLSQLDGMLMDQRRVNLESQEAVLHTRMVPVQTVISRLQRSVRQTCRLTGRQAELRVEGADTLMDSEVLNALIDPLMHLLRNAVDHGIESPESRKRLGKPETGQVTLEFRREGNHIMVRCHDDGGGLDAEAIRRAAERRGVITSEQTLTQDELNWLVLQPTFSTRTQVTQTSGRGIGLDAVYERVMHLSGSLDIRAKEAGGLLVELRLPVTLISTHALLVRVAQHVVAVSDRGIEQILYSGSGELGHMGEDAMYQVDNAFYPAKPIEDLLNLQSNRRTHERASRPALLVRFGTEVAAVLVEEVIDSRELVVKGMGKYLPKMRGIVGATILGDGRVTPVVDLPELLRSPAKLARVRPMAPEDIGDTAAVLPRALVVDDSLSARRALAQLMTDSGYEVRTARDGMEAIEVIEASKPDVLLVDLEMPRMNGMELARHVRASDDTRNLPVIMVTSRSTEKHRQQAKAAGVNAYLVKPFSEDELLQHVTTLRNQA